MCPAVSEPGSSRGWIIPVGGGEKKVRSSPIMQRFVELCGDSDAKIVIIPTASKREDAGERTAKVLRELGVTDIEIIDLATRDDCQDTERLVSLESATGIFMTGGNQVRLSTIIGGTAAAKAIRRANANGTHVAGTSAGAAFISEHMIAIGKPGPTPRRGMASLSPGLGLTNRVIIDQHFRERDRVGRLMTALAYNPFAVGIGVDEDTAAFISPDDIVEVYGSGGLTILDPTHLKHSSMAEASYGAPVSLIDMRLHILLAGDSYDLNTKLARPAQDGEAQ